VMSVFFCVSVSLSVRQHNSGITRPNLKFSLYVTHACAPPSSSGGAAIDIVCTLCPSLFVS